MSTIATFKVPKLVNEPNVSLSKYMAKGNSADIYIATLRKGLSRT